MASTAQIVQLTTPADGGGGNSGIFWTPAFDWPRKKLYIFQYHALRSYRIALETQDPILSWVHADTVIFCPGADVDPLTGNLIAQYSYYDGASNSYPITRYNPDTFEATGRFGNYGVFFNWPGGIWYGERIVCVTCGTLASGGASQVCYALCKESAFSGAVGVIRCDTMQQAGFYEGVVSGSVDNRGTICRGASGPAGATVFAVGNNYASTGAPVIPVHCITILPGAETYDSTSWPATNPYISQRVVSNLAAPMIDPTWTNFYPTTLGYDQADGNVLMFVRTFDAVTHNEYLIKVSASTGEVLWATPWPVQTTYGTPFLEQQNIDEHNVLGLISQTQHSSLAPDTGALSLGLDTMGGIFLDSLPGSGGGSGSLSDVSGSWFLAAVSWYDSTRPNAPIPVEGTPNSFGGSLAWIYYEPAALPAKLALDNIVIRRPTGDFSLAYRWRSRQFYLPAPASLGACQVSLNSMVLKHAPDALTIPPLDASDPLTVLPAGVNALFRLYVGPKGRTLFFEKVLDQPRMIFRLPSGRKAFNWQFEVVARVPIHSVELASTMRELKGV